MSVCALRMHLEHLLVRDNRIIRAACAQKSAGEIVLRFFLVRYDREARPVPGDGAIEITFGYKYVRKIAGGFGVVGPDFERLLIMGNCVVKLTSLNQESAQVIMRLRVIRPQGNGLPVMLDRLIRFSLLAENDTEIVMRHPGTRIFF